MVQNLAQEWIRNSGREDLELSRISGLPREYLRALRRGKRPPKFNSGKGRVLATDDPRWQALAHIAYPDNESLQARFIEAIVALQTGEETGAPTTAPEATQPSEPLIITVGEDFQGTVTFRWQGRVYALTRVS